MLDHLVPLVPLLVWLVCDGLAHWPLLQAGWLVLVTPQASPTQPQRSTAPTAAPDCPACAAAEGETLATARRERPSRIEQQGGRPRTVDTSSHHCPRQSCRYYGWVGLGNIRANGHPNGGRWRQLECIVCGKTFMETISTIFYGKKVAAETIWQALKALAEGLGIQSTARVFDVETNAVEEWLGQAAEHMEAVSDYLIHHLQLTQVQVDELWALLGQQDSTAEGQKQRAKRWIWAGMDPVSKLLLACLVGARSLVSAQLLIHAIACLLAPGCVPLFISDQWSAYGTALLTHFGHWVAMPRRHRLGRSPKPRWLPLPNLQYAQVVKKRVKGRVVSVSHRVVYGSLEQVTALMAQSGVGKVINTAFVERLNLNIRQHVAALGRKVISLAKTEAGLTKQLLLRQGYYNFCLPHSALRLPLPEPQHTKGSGSPKKWQLRTPGMASGVTDRIWRLEELLLFRVPPWRQPLPAAA